jgi:hypothetical protein
VRLRLDLNFAVACYYPEQIEDIGEKVEMKTLVPTETVLMIAAEDLRVVVMVKKSRK